MKLVISCSGNYVSPGAGVYGPYEDDDDVLKLVPANWAEEYGDEYAIRTRNGGVFRTLRQELAEDGYWEVTIKLRDDVLYPLDMPMPLPTAAAEWRSAGLEYLNVLIANLDDDTAGIWHDKHDYVQIDVDAPNVRFIEPIAATA